VQQEHNMEVDVEEEEKVLSNFCELEIADWAQYGSCWCRRRNSKNFCELAPIIIARSNNVVQFVGNFDFMCIDHHHFLLLLLLLLLLFADYLTDLAASLSRCFCRCSS
jgi:hypothetical protein